MCLRRIDKKAKLPKGEVIAWKGLAKSSIYDPKSDFSFPCFDFLKTNKIGKWMKARKEKVEINFTGENYLSGFHVYATKKGLENSIFKNERYHAKVVVKGIRLVGEQDKRRRAKVFVADEMKVLELIPSS